MSGTLFDPGLQPERTDLAWRRTAITIVLGAIVSLRLLPATFGGWAITLGFLALGVSSGVWILARRRAFAVQRVLLGVNGHLPDGALPLALALMTAGGGLVGLAYVALS